MLRSSRYPMHRADYKEKKLICAKDLMQHRGLSRSEVYFGHVVLYIGPFGVLTHQLSERRKRESLQHCDEKFGSNR